MSIIKYSPNEIIKLKDNIIYLLCNNEHFKNYVCNLDIYKTESFKRTFIISAETKLSNYEICTRLFEKLFIYLHVANSVAYALETKKQPRINFSAFEQKPIIIEMNKLDILKNLEELRYNIILNNGDYFLSYNWENFLEKIIEYFKET